MSGPGDYEDEPRRRRDEYEDEPRRGAGYGGGPVQPGGLEGMLLSTGTFVLFCFLGFCCCAPGGLIVGIIGLTSFQNPLAKRNAMILTVVSGIALVLNIIGTGVQLAMKK
jgi:hypothetical protein